MSFQDNCTEGWTILHVKTLTYRTLHFLSLPLMAHCLDTRRPAIEYIYIYFLLLLLLLVFIRHCICDVMEFSGNQSTIYGFCWVLITNILRWTYSINVSSISWHMVPIFFNLGKKNPKLCSCCSKCCRNWVCIFTCLWIDCKINLPSWFGRPVGWSLVSAFPN